MDTIQTLEITLIVLAITGLTGYVLWYFSSKQRFIRRVIKLLKADDKLVQSFKDRINNQKA